MKKNIHLFLGFILCLLSNSYGQITFTDPNFKQALVNNTDINTNSDTEISKDEALAVTILNLDDKNISNLDGIEFFGVYDKFPFLLKIPYFSKKLWISKNVLPRYFQNT